MTSQPHLAWWVYVIAEEGAVDGPAKVGTARNVAYRLSGLQNGNWRRLTVLGCFQVAGRDDALALERRVQSLLSAHRLPNRDWFLCSPAKILECLRGLGCK